MPRRQRQAKPVGPFDLSTIQLPYGSELDALSSGFARERAGRQGYRQGYTNAATLANANTLLDATTQQPWILADTKTGLLRSQNAPQLFAGPYKDDMETIFTSPGATNTITAEQFTKGNAWKSQFKLSKNTPLTGPLADIGHQYVRLSGDVLLHHRPDIATAQPAFVAPHVAALTSPPPKGRIARMRANLVAFTSP